jgi:peptide/nickel transport system substrate-binding protein
MALPVRRPRLGRSLPTRISIAMAVSVFALAGCSSATSSSGSSEPVAGGTLNVLRRNPFEGFNLDKESLNATFQLSQAVLEPLVRSSDDGTSLEPGIATSWEFGKGNKSLTLHLDPKATFSDGSPVTPADVAFSVDTWKSGVNYGATYGVITKVTQVDPHTVRFDLDYADTALPAFLAWAAAGVLPKDFGGKTADEFWQHPIGAGPFAVQEWSPEGQVVLTRNAHYYRADRPYVDKVVSSYAADPNSITMQLASGQVDIADELFPVTAQTVPKDEVVPAPAHSTNVLLMNTKTPALSDVHVRRAIGYALDYQGMVDTALKGYGSVPTGALPTNSGNWAAPHQPYFTKDGAKAQAELAQAGAAPSQLTLTYANDATSSLMAQIIQSDLKAIGIDVKLQAADPGNNYATMSSGNYQLGMFTYNAISPDISDPAVYVAATSGIFTGYDGGRLFGLLSRYWAADDAKAKREQVADMQDLLFQDAPFLALSHGQVLTAAGKKTHGLHVLPWGNYYLDEIWKS